MTGVYTFGFIAMTPQLFVNYKLKSVAHLPWKPFMYKAFNTFIDDVFSWVAFLSSPHSQCPFLLDGFDSGLFFCFCDSILFPRLTG